MNLCTNRDGDIIHLPEPQFSVTDQAPRFLRAVETVRGERSSRWFAEMQKDWAKESTNGGS